MKDAWLWIMVALLSIGGLFTSLTARRAERRVAVLEHEVQVLETQGRPSGDHVVVYQP